MSLWTTRIMMIQRHVMRRSAMQLVQFDLAWCNASTQHEVRTLAKQSFGVKRRKAKAWYQCVYHTARLGSTTWYAQVPTPDSCVSWPHMEISWLSWDIHIHTPAKESCVKFIMCPFAVENCSTNSLGLGHGYECHSPCCLGNHGNGQSGDEKATRTNVHDYIYIYI